MKLLVLKEHHGDVYLDVSTPEKFNAVVLSIVKGRFQAEPRHDYYGPIELPPEPTKPSVPADQITSIPDGPVRTAAYQEHETYRSRMRYWRAVAEQAELARKAIEEHDAKAAWHLLDIRSRYEDEGYRIEELDDLYYTEKVPTP